VTTEVSAERRADLREFRTVRRLATEYAEEECLMAGQGWVVGR
jgi:hypothetical protein